MRKQGVTFISVREVATMLDTTETRVLMMLRQKVLAGRLADNGWEVDRASLHGCGKPQADGVVRPGCGGGCSSGCGSLREGGGR